MPGRRERGEEPRLREADPRAADRHLPPAKVHSVHECHPAPAGVQGRGLAFGNQKKKHTVYICRSSIFNGVFVV